MTTHKKPHKHLQSSVARLMAVQARYGLSHNKEPVKTVLNDYLSRYSEMEIEDEKLALPDQALLSSVLQGVEKRGDEIQGMIDSVLRTADNDSDAKTLEPLLNSIVLCGGYELMAHHDIDAPVIINDYLDVTHSFYSKSEVSLVNGVLDQLRVLLRS